MIVRKITAFTKNNANNSDILLFFTGWGMDEHPVLEYLPVDRDCIICYDYSSLSFDQTMLAPYTNIQVVAWSMGVWAASQVLAGSGLPILKSTAVNGTTWPVDDEKGIAADIFRDTLLGLNEKTLQRFQKRMCATKEAFAYFVQRLPQRGLDDLRVELYQIGRQALACRCQYADTGDAEQLENIFDWDEIIISANDRIFLPANQQKAWQGKKTTTIPCGHYPYSYWTQIFGEENL